MKKKDLLSLILIVALVGVAFLLLEVFSDKRNDNGAPKISEFDIAYNFVKNEASTYVYDGDNLNLVSQSKDIESGVDYFNFSFVSRSAGYGDRSDQMSAQVITMHEIEVGVSNGLVVSALVDGIYDELSGTMIGDDISDVGNDLILGDDLMEIDLYFVKVVDGQEYLESVTRSVPVTLSIGRQAIYELLKGPSLIEMEEGYLSFINDDVVLQSIDIEDGIARVDFSESIEEGVAGSAWVSMIRSQIEETLKQFETVNEVVILVNGEEDILQP